MQTISEVEAELQCALDSLRKLNLSPENKHALRLLLPEGLQPVVQLEEDGRKKRSSADASNWNPRSGEIRIYFDPVALQPTPQKESQPAPALPHKLSASKLHPTEISEAKRQIVVIEAASDALSPQEIVECCQLLAEAEKSNRQFISLKWFRDDFLATVDFKWTKTSQSRQRVLSHALDMGRIVAKKIPNPKSTFPTTTISLNRSIPTAGVAPRFQPISVQGELVSATLLRDRGSV